MESYTPLIPARGLGNCSVLSHAALRAHWASHAGKDYMFSVITGLSRGAQRSFLQEPLLRHVSAQLVLILHWKSIGVS